MNKYRVTLSKGRNGQTTYAVEEFLPDTNEWGIVKIFNNHKSAEDERQTLEAYGKAKL